MGLLICQMCSFMPVASSFPVFYCLFPVCAARRPLAAPECQVLLRLTSSPYSYADKVASMVQDAASLQASLGAQEGDAASIAISHIDGEPPRPASPIAGCVSDARHPAGTCRLCG